MSKIDLGSIPLGSRIPVDFVPDEPVDVKTGGAFGSVAVTSGDSTAVVAPGSTDVLFRVYFNGDGALGPKSATVSADAHIGPADVEITLEVTWLVVSQDATVLTATIKPVELIPVPVPAKV